MRSLLCLLLVVGCDDSTPEREIQDAAPTTRIDAEPDAEPPEPDAADASPPDPDDGVPVDAEVVEPDAAPDGPPPPPEECNGLDDDLDGEIDEGVANICGGCGGIPAEGCQAWRIEALQNSNDILNPDRVVGLLGGALGLSERDVDNARCTFFRTPAPQPEAHLGLVNIDTPRAALNLVPTSDEVFKRITYINSPALDPLQLFGSGEAIRVRAGGGSLVAGFEAEIVAPTLLGGIRSNDLRPLLERARGQGEGDVELTWEGVDEDSTLTLFVGGSLNLFTNVIYRAIQHYQLEARLVDDGEIVVPAALFGGGVPESAIRVYFERRRRVRRPFGPHLVEIGAGQRLQEAQGGNLDRMDPPPFQIVEPSPNGERTIEPGEPLLIRWSELPEGEGPLSINLVMHDSVEQESRQVTCEVIDPSLGEATLPGEFTAIWPQGDDDVRQLSLRWDVASQALAPPDRGALVTALSVILKLAPTP